MSSKPVGPLPIILCGKTENIGRAVIEGLKPDIEVVQFILTPQAGAREIPEILQGRTPTDSSSDLGTGNFSSGAKAIVTGGAYDDEGLSVMQKAVSKVADVVWLRHDAAKPAPPPGPEYGKAMVLRVKEALGRLQAEGTLDGDRGGTFWY